MERSGRVLSTEDAEDQADVKAACQEEFLEAVTSLLEDSIFSLIDEAIKRKYASDGSLEGMKT